jgi:hypothetical protein
VSIVDSIVPSSNCFNQSNQSIALVASTDKHECLTLSDTGRNSRKRRGRQRLRLIGAKSNDGNSKREQK